MTRAKIFIGWIIATALLGLLLGACVVSDMVSGSDGGRARNVILFIGDGMGQAQVVAASYVQSGQQGADTPGLFFEAFPVLGYLTTHSEDSFVTDSAAAGTALACGIKTTNGTIGQTSDGVRAQSILEYAHGLGMATGDVTSVQVNHATPACFASHVESRQQYSDILDQYLADRTAEVFLGGGLAGDDVSIDDVAQRAQSAGYRWIGPGEGEQLLTVIPGERLFGSFDENGDGHLDYPSERRELQSTEPHLHHLALAAVEALSADPDGFFLMVEGGAIDWACHANQIQNTVDEVLELDRTIEAVCERLEEMGRLDETLIIVTADHETGGLTLPGPYRQTLAETTSPEFAWSSGNHTAIPVLVWARGPGAEALSGRHDETFVVDAIKAALGR
ncbi:alkaline phosphatase [Candidatus Sumerlaeota bacterium]|nr:alkaline phosphatase [Candidatus Sumerlaeota bacterium]